MGIGLSIVTPKIMSQFREQKIKVLHAMPGRLRIQCDSWKNDTVANALNKNIEKHPFILSAKASSITGSLTIEFIMPHISQQDLDELMQLIVQTASDAIVHTDAKLIRGFQKTLGTLDKGIKRQTNGLADSDSLIVLFLLLKGVQSFSHSPAFSSSLLYWAYTIIKGKGSEQPHD